MVYINHATKKYRNSELSKYFIQKNRIILKEMDKSSINKRFVDCVNYILSTNTEINKGEISTSIGVKANTFSEILNLRMNIATDHIANFIETFPVISPDWLLTGKGSMLKSDLKNDSGCGDSKNKELIRELIELSRQLGEQTKENEYLRRENTELYSKIDELKKGNKENKSKKRHSVYGGPDIAAEPEVKYK